MSMVSKMINFICKISGIKKIYGLDEDEFIAKVRKMNTKRGFKLPLSKKAYFEDQLIFDRYHCLKIMPDNVYSKRAILFFFGGGMVLDSDSGDIDVACKLTNETKCDVWFPYYPLCLDHDIKESIEMSFECYKKMLERYGVMYQYLAFLQVDY